MCTRVNICVCRLLIIRLLSYKTDECVIYFIKKLVCVCMCVCSCVLGEPVFTCDFLCEFAFAYKSAVF